MFAAAFWTGFQFFISKTYSLLMVANNAEVRSGFRIFVLVKIKVIAWHMTSPFAYVFQPCRADEIIIGEGEKKGRQEVKTVEKVAQETMIAEISREETEEVLDFMKMLNPYEKREFIGFMRGAKIVKTFQEEKRESIGELNSTA